MDLAGPTVEPAYHRVVDPGDPPREMSGLAWGAMVCLGILGLLILARAVAVLDLRATVTGGGDITAAQETYAVWSGLSGLFVFLTAAVFIAWFFRAYKNLQRLGLQGMRYGSGWAIGAWFIPIFGMIRPKQIANDIWRGSEQGVDTATHWHRVAVPPIAHWWWGLFLVQGVLGEIGVRMTDSGYHHLVVDGLMQKWFSRMETGTAIDALGCLCGLAAVFLAIKVVSRVSRRLDGIREDVLLGRQTRLQPAVQ